MANRIYIPVPITGHDENVQRARVEKWEKLLIQKGWEVENPFTIGDRLIDEYKECGKGFPTWQDFMNVDLPIVDTCNAIIMLDGWEQSKGYKLELERAHGLLTVYTEGTFLV